MNKAIRKEKRRIEKHSMASIQEGYKIPLVTGNYGLYEEDAREDDQLVIWDLDMGMYVPIELIDWDRMIKDPKSIIKD